MPWKHIKLLVKLLSEIFGLQTVQLLSFSHPLFFLRVEGQQLLMTLQTGECTCVCVSICLRDMESLSVESVSWSWLAWWTKAGKQLWPLVSRLLCYFLLFFTFYSSFLSMWIYPLVGVNQCVWQCVDSHTQQEPHVVTRAHQEKAIKTAPCQFAL